jgi:hypothetical protein
MASIAPLGICTVLPVAVLLRSPVAELLFKAPLPRT